jgi:hypothetical protein
MEDIVRYDTANQRNTHNESIYYENDPNKKPENDKKPKM